MPFGIIFTFVLRLAIRARRTKVTTGSAGMIGLIGRAETAIAPQGTIFVRGELSKARSKVSIGPGDRVRVTGMDGLLLDVEADKEPG